MLVFTIKMTPLHFSAEEIINTPNLQLPDIPKEVKKEINNKAKEAKHFILDNPEAPKKVLLSKTCLKKLASLLLDVKMSEVEVFLYTLPPSVKDQLVPLIIEEYHRRCAKG